MKKSVALLALMASLCFGAESTTSTIKIDVKNQSFLERVGGYYWSALSKDVLSIDNQDNPGSSWLNYINLSYKLTNDSSLSTTFRFEVVDTALPNGRGDRFNELDQRIAYTKTLLTFDDYSIGTLITIELPTSRDSQADDRLMRLKPDLYLAASFDDYNSLFASMGYRKTLYNKANSSISETSRHYFAPTLSYKNKYFSERYVLKAEYANTIDHVPGTVDTNIRKDDAGEELDVGVEFNAFNFSIYPYLAHNPSSLKASNMLGGGIQAFRAF